MIRNRNCLPVIVSSTRNSGELQLIATSYRHRPLVHRLVSDVNLVVRVQCSVMSKFYGMTLATGPESCVRTKTYLPH
jgi:hypothetical protein